LKEEPRVTVVNTKNDTLIQVKVADAKIILKDVLDKEVCDEMVVKLNDLDSLRIETILNQTSKIETLEEKLVNETAIVINLEKVIDNNKTETAFLNETIKKQNREILRQKTFKILNFSIALAIPIGYLILHH
jgi:hypothetical protein